MKDGAEKRERICREGKQGVKPEGREGRGAGEGRRRREEGGERDWRRENMEQETAEWEEEQRGQRKGEKE